MRYSTETQELTPESVIAELYELVGKKFPLEVSVQNGKVVYIDFDENWTEGGSTPITGTAVTIDTVVDPKTGEKVEVETVEETVVGYEVNATPHSLTDEDLSKIDKWAKKNIQ